MALGCIALCTNAQKLEQVLSVSDEDNPHGIIPSEVLMDDRTEFWMGKSETAESRQSFLLKSLTVYDENFNPKITLSAPTSIIPISYRDSYRDSYCVPVTQDLFNDDDAYEFIVASSSDFDGATNGFSIVQEDGTILYTMLFGEKECLNALSKWNENNLFNIEVLHVGGSYYLCVNIHISDPSYAGFDIKRIYAFERGSIKTSIKKVRDIPLMKVSPTLPQKNEAIKIDLADMKSPNKLSVIDTNGKICFTQTIQANQKNVEFSTSGMPAGMYVIRITDGNKEVDNCRVIIR